MGLSSASHMTLPTYRGPKKCGGADGWSSEHCCLCDFDNCGLIWLRSWTECCPQAWLGLGPTGNPFPIARAQFSQQKTNLLITMLSTAGAQGLGAPQTVLLPRVPRHRLEAFESTAGKDPCIIWEHVKKRNLPKKPQPFFKCLAQGPSEANCESGWGSRGAFPFLFHPSLWHLQSSPSFNSTWGGSKGFVCAHRENFCLQGCPTCLHPEDYCNFLIKAKFVGSLIF